MCWSSWVTTKAQRDHAGNQIPLLRRSSRAASDKVAVSAPFIRCRRRRKESLINSWELRVSSSASKLEWRGLSRLAGTVKRENQLHVGKAGFGNESHCPGDKPEIVG